MKESRRQPIFWLLVPLLLGLITFQIMPLPLLVVAVVLLTSLIVLFATRWVAPLYLIIYGVGYLIASLNISPQPLEGQSATTMTIKMGRDNQGILLSQSIDGQGNMAECNHKVLVWGDTDLSHKILLIEGDIIPIDKEASRYSRTMHRKGFRANVKISKILSHDNAPQIPLSARMNAWALGRLESLELNAPSHALASAVALAHREELPREIVESYNRSGTGHLLALSGLHIGVVLLLISAIIFFAPLMPGGHIVADVVSIIFIWLFTLMAGMGESVMRAAWMFSLIKLSSLLSKRYNSLNSLLVASVAILCLDPSALYDLGFMLSVVAVAAIITLGVPLAMLLRRGNIIVDFLSSSIIIGTVATLSTAPLIAYAFGQFSILSPLATLPLLLTTALIIITTLVAIVSPLPLLLPLFRLIIEASVSLQNYLVQWFATFEWGVVSYRFTEFDLVISYATLATLIFLTSRLIELRGRNHTFDRTRD